MAALVREVRERWHGLFALDGRRLECDVGDAPSDARVAGRPVSEVLGILLDNARVHGRGSVGVVVRDLEGALAFDVSDEGRIEGEAARLFDRGHTEGGSGTGIGLALARDLAAAVGGKLSLKSNVPATFTLLVPVRHDDNQRGASTAR
ncbi:ATP-binding protein [Streptomyces sp. NPDC001156]